MKPTNDTLEVVGVARDVKYNTLGEDPQLAIYVPLAQAYSSAATLHVRTAGDPARLAGQVRSILRDLEPKLPLISLRTVPEVLDALLWRPAPVPCCWPCSAPSPCSSPSSASTA